MDDLFPLLLFLIFILAPIIEGLKKKGQQKPPPRVPQRRPETRERTSAQESTTQPRDAAASMIPDELWQILTGEARPAPTVPAPRPSEADKQRPWDVVYIPAEDTEDEEALTAEDVDVEVRRSTREEVRREHAVRHKPAEAVSLEVPANIISLETPRPSAAARHSAFHQKRDRQPLAFVARPSARKKLGLTSRTELQRAFLLQEIFGKPRGLE
ncbi:MAG: hypothetical protein ACT4O1_05590 [Gemmatimonadota bacterium]